ncbi:MAG: PhoH family protein [Acidobacteriota bacterium]|nr:PhoH family protein [Acidobacteriota bacterium]MDH3524568.1 PhoH family protein [Acidobacteriota bacterium]
MTIPRDSGPPVVDVTLGDEGIAALFGTRDENLRHIERAFEVSLSARGNRVRIAGDPARQEVVQRLLQQMSALLDRGYRLQADDVDTAVRVLQEAPETSLESFFLPEGGVARVGDRVRPRSLGQRLYLQAMADHDLVISVGPAGTGKTYLAVAMAAIALQENQVKRLVLARPAVEAGEKLGFLPGDLVEKVNPYLRPLYDALYDIIGFERVSRMLERGTIEVAPLAFMRGRTLNDSFIILDEAQNTTSEQMKMFLTRVGFNSKAVVNGDVTQIDLPSRKASGLVEAVEILSGIEGIKFIKFTERDVVRHPLVAKIIGAYERAAPRARDDSDAGTT